MNPNKLMYFLLVPVILSACSTGGMEMENFGAPASVFDGIRQFKLPNGLTCYIKEQREVPNVAVAVGYRVGSYDESDETRGASHFLEHMMFKNTKRFKTGDIDKIAFEGGGISNAYTSSDVTVYYFKVNSDALKRVLDAESERMVNMMIEEEELNRERKVVLEELNRQMDSPWGKMYDEIHKLMFTQSPFKHPVIGYRERLEKISAPQLMDHYKRYYKPANAFLVVIGDVETDKTMKLIEELFSSIGGTEIESPNVVIEPKQNEYREATIELTGSVPRCIIAYKTDSVGTHLDVVSELIDTLLCGSRTAVLNKVIVEEKKLVRQGGISTFNFSEPFGGGSLQILFEPKPAIPTKKVSEEILKVVEGYADIVTEEELRKAKNIAQSRFVYSNESLQQIVLNLAHMATIGQLDHYTNYLDKIENVTLNDVKSVLTEYFSSDKANVVIGVPKEGAKLGGELPQSKDNHRVLYYREADIDQTEWKASDGTKVDQVAKKLTNFDIGEVWKIRMENGLTLILKPIKTLPIVNIRAFVDVGSFLDPEGKAGLASLIGSMLDEGINDGTQVMSYQEISDFIEGKGSDLNTQLDGFSIKALSKHLNSMLEISKYMLLYASFPEERLHKLKEDTISEIKTRMDHPKYQLFNGFREAVYQGTPLSRPDIGYSDTVAGITRDDVIKFYKKYYRPENSMLVICGNFDLYETLKRVGILFSEWDKGSESINKEIAVNPLTKTKKVVIEKDTVQANILLGHLGITKTNPDYHKLKVLETILGRGPLFYDRLSKEIREKNGLAYEVWGLLTNDADVHPGTVTFYIGTELKNKDAAQKMAVDIIGKFVEEGPTVEELAGAKEYVLRSMFSQWETMTRYSSYLLETAKYGYPFDFYKRVVNSIRSLELDESKELLNKYLKPDQLITVTVGKGDEK